jgi:hypothetical protein
MTKRALGALRARGFAWFPSGSGSSGDKALLVALDVSAAGLWDSWIISMVKAGFADPNGESIYGDEDATENHIGDRRSRRNTWAHYDLQARAQCH